MNLFKYASISLLLFTAVACQAQTEPGSTQTAVPAETTSTPIPAFTATPLPERPEPSDSAEPEAQTESEEREPASEAEGDQAPIQVTVAEPFTLQVGETAVSNQITMTFLEVTEDSRCPESVTCVWEGQGVVAVALSNGGGQTTRTQLNTNLPDNNVTYNQVEIQLTELIPYPQTPDPIPQEAYRAVFVLNEVAE